ncbi:hypothetical protein GCM10010168_67900 [Actinoplanes ianthinogenes]|uniref:DUF5941 domain-containing protein n=1 Tax=Actinoplanes ianthinogenes TaxID=122358 RepID=A0ABM7LXE8_9ACTN|nr:DUF5941 domain-containing protein [Actinoplanes ianthinogenes]BCJ43987.1 hypothetical protein Aiant_46440 [Actinoplanes ianthinogenes]GGR39589.1 hypothetical protein GCM10010168_67900 [Actinoplanes ianthinogenes]
MPLALLYPGAGAALAGDELSRDLIDALHAAGATEIDRVESGADLPGRIREAGRRAHDAGEALLICADDLVTHHSLLWMLATDPAGRSTVLLTPDPAGDLREDRGRAVPAAGAGTVRFLGAMCLAPTDLLLLEKVVDRLPAYGKGIPTETGRDAAADSAGGADLAAEVDLAGAGLLGLLLEAGLVPAAVRVRLLHAERVRTDAEFAAARRRVDGIDEERARLRLAVKEQDDFFTTYAVSSWSPLVTRTAARLGLSPTAVTGLSVLFAGAAALSFWQASRIAMILGGILLYLGFVLDCVDGQLARYTRRFDAFGGWLDTMADRAKEYAVYAGLAAGADRIGLPYAWPLAITAIALQTVRHMTDTWYGALHDEAAARPRPQAAGGVGARLSAASQAAQSSRGSLIYWAKRIVVFPIGERWALIAVAAALTNGRVALTAIVGFGALAFVYTLSLRSLRALSMRVAVLNTVDTARHRDDGWLARYLLGRARMDFPLVVTAVLAAYAMVGPAVGEPLRTGILAGGIPAALAAGMTARARHDRALDWLVPAALRAAEYLFVILAGVVGGVPWPLVFLVLFVLALRHYDLTARMEKGAPGTRAGAAVLGWEGRTVLLIGVTLAGFAIGGFGVLAALAGGVFLITAARDWRASRER